MVKLPHHKNAYSISMYSFRENDSFLKEENMEFFISFPHYGNFLLHRSETIQGRKLLAEIRYQYLQGFQAYFYNAFVLPPPGS